MFLLLFTFSFLEVAMSSRSNPFVCVENLLCFSLEFHFESQSAHCHCPHHPHDPLDPGQQRLSSPPFYAEKPEHGHPFMPRALSLPSKHFAKKEFFSSPKGVSEGICFLRTNARISTNELWLKEAAVPKGMLGKLNEWMRLPKLV